MMNTKLLERSVSERMFARQSMTVEKLLANASTSARVIERHLAALTTKWNVLQEKHDSYVVEFVTDTVELSANDALIDKYLSEFIRLEAACDTFTSLPVLSQPAPPTIDNSIKLEKVKFRTFDGNLRCYPKFKSEFETYVKPLCQPKQLPFVLKSYLCESVRREVEHIDHDVAAMWSRLDEKYGSVQKHVDCILKDFKYLPKCSDFSSTVKMISLVENAEADLKCLNASDQLENSLIISYIENCMSTRMTEAWAEEIANDKTCKSSKAKFSKLSEFLKHWRWLLEYFEADIRNPSVSNDSHSDTDSDFERPSSHKCLVHPDANHPVWRCRAFQAMTLAERNKIVESSAACRHCLVVGHTASDCKLRFRCTAPNCRSSQHNVLLHSTDSCGGGVFQQ